MHQRQSLWRPLAKLMSEEMGYGQDDEWNHSDVTTIIQPEFTTSIFNVKIRCDLIGLEMIETNKKCITTFGFSSWVGPTVSTLNFVRYNWRINNWHWWKWCYTFLVEPKETCISIISRSFSDLWSSKSAHELAASVTLEIVWNFSLVWYLLS